MNLLEILISSLLGSVILISLTQSGYQIYSSLDQQVAKATLQSEALQALQMMGEAIHMASASKGSSIPRLMVKDSSSMSNTQVGQFQVRKGAASMGGSDAFFTTNKQEDMNYQAFFVQQQGHHEQRDEVLYIQTKNNPLVCGSSSPGLTSITNGTQFSVVTFYLSFTYINVFEPDDRIRSSITLRIPFHSAILV